MTDPWLILALLSPLVTGWAIVCACIRPGRGIAPAVTCWIMAAIIGHAVASVHYLLWRSVGVDAEELYRVADCLLLPVLAWIVLRRRVGAAIQSDMAIARSHPGTWVLMGLAAAVALGALGIMAGIACKEPLGHWDAWAIWNLKARFLYLGHEEQWMRLFSRPIWFSHPDYPLMLPALVARLWSYVGHETTLVPQIIALSVGASVMVLLFASLAWLKGLVHAAVAVMLLAASEPFLIYAPAQIADVPLSVCVLGAVVLISLTCWCAGDDGRASQPLLVLAGVLGGCGAMLKNEGIVICVALLLGAAALRLGSVKIPLRPLFMGMLPGLVLVGLQKALFFGQTYLTADQPSNAAILDKLLDLSRHKLILQAWWNHNLALRPWQPMPDWALTLTVPVNPPLLLLGLIAACGLRPNRVMRPIALWLFLSFLFMALMYHLVLVIMPYDLSLLVGSIPRLQLHIWPALIFAVLSMMPAVRPERTSELAHRTTSAEWEPSGVAGNDYSNRWTETP